MSAGQHNLQLVSWSKYSSAGQLVNMLVSWSAGQVVSWSPGREHAGQRAPLHAEEAAGAERAQRVGAVQQVHQLVPCSRVLASWANRVKTWPR